MEIVLNRKIFFRIEKEFSKLKKRFSKTENFVRIGRFPKRVQSKIDLEYLKKKECWSKNEIFNDERKLTCNDLSIQFMISRKKWR